jgi:tetratricopeptide (TPR) repeat protein
MNEMASLGGEQVSPTMRDVMEQALALLRQLDQGRHMLDALMPDLLAQSFSAQTLNRFGEVYQALGSSESAKTCFERAFDRNPTDSDAANNLGVLAFGDQDLDRAERFFRCALELNPANRSALENLEALDDVPAERSTSDRDKWVLVYQMSKVASTAICAALEKRGFIAEHSHYLGEALLKEMLSRVVDPDLDAYVVFHTTGQFIRNMNLTRRLNVSRRRAAIDGRRVKIITAVRDPLAWFSASYVQDFAGYERRIAAWLESRGLSGSLPVYERVAHMQRALMAYIESGGLDLSAPIRESTPSPEGLIGDWAVRMTLPMKWFDERFLPVVGIDVYAEPFDVRQGYSIYRNDFADVLLFQFERLGELAPAIGRFVGVHDLVIERQNVTANKSNASEIRSAVQDTISPAVRDAVYASRYCRHFGYQPATHATARSPS